MKKINTLIIDDEPFARKRISRLLKDTPDFKITGECKNGDEALRLINNETIDLVFLDIQMPEMNGFEVLEKINPVHMPFVVFVTAYDQYALKAFDVHAIDYLLKPFDDERFFAAANHAREQILQRKQNSFKEKLIHLINEFSGLKLKGNPAAPSEEKYIRRIAVKSSGRIYFLKTEDIDRIKAAGKYLRIQTGSEEHVIRQTLSSLENKLDPEQFLRIHRSVIINLEQIREIQHWYKNEYVFILKNGEKFTSGSSYRNNLDGILAQLS